MQVVARAVTSPAFGPGFGRALSQTGDVKVVATAAAFQDAVVDGWAHIEVQAHLDLTGLSLAYNSNTSMIPTTLGDVKGSTRTIRVRFVVSSRLHGCIQGPPSGPDALIIDFTAGYADAAAVPEPMKLAVKALAAHWYENREEAGVDRFHTSPQSLNALMAPWRRVRV